MASKQFNSVDGYSVGSTPSSIIDANGNITGNAITATANVTAPRLISNIATGTAPFVVTSTTQVANLSVATAGSATTAGTVTTAAQPNITSVGTLTSLGVSGTVTASTLTSNVATGTAPLTVTSTTRVANLNVAYANVADFISVAAGTGNNFLIFANAATGNITELTSTGLIANLSNNSITATTFVGALSGAATSATTAGTVTTAAQPNITSVGTLTGLTANGNVTVNQNAAEIFTIAARQPPTTDMVLITNTGQNVATAGVSALQINYTGGAGAIEASAYRSDMTPGTTSGSTWNAFRVAATTAAASGVVFNGMKFDNKSTGAGTSRAFYVGTGYDEILNYNGTIVINGNGTVVGGQVVGTVPSATTAGTVTTAAQPNITSVGTLTSLGVNGTVTAVAFTANTGVFTGNANGLSSLQAGNLTGTVAQARLANSTLTLGNTTLTLGGTTTTVAGLTSVTSTTFVGALTGAATTAGTVTTAAQPNITSVGTLTSLGVNGTVTAVAFTANTGVFTGNGSGLSAIAGANVTGTVSSATTATSATTAGTVTTAAQPNITSVGTLSSLSVTGNVAAGNLTTTGVLSVTGTGVSSIAGNLDMTSNTIINLATPTNPQDAATKQYVDDIAQGLHTHDSCNAATQTTLASISGGTVTYNNGTSGVGATLTTTGSYTTIDGVTLSNGMRILVKNEANTAHNGIYDRTSTTVLTRSTDFDTPTEMAGGDFTFVTAGTLYDNTGWVMTDAVTTVGTSPVPWVQFSGAGTYTAGTGLTLTGSVFSVNASQTQVTAVGTLTGLNSSGTITAPAFTANTGIFTGNGSGLSAIAGANVTGTVASATSATTATTAGTVTTAAQPNITSVGTLTSLGVSGAVTASTLTSNVATGTAPIVVTSTTRVSNLNVAYANVADNINVAAGTGNNYLIFANAATGNVAELTSTGLLANLSNNSITATTFVGALSGAATSATTAGTVTTAAQPNITSVGTLTSLAITGNATAGNIGVSGNITAPNITANTGIFTGNGSGLSAIAGANVTGTVASATAATTAGTVTTAAQPNITSVGTLTSLGVNGTITGTRLISNIATGTAPLTVTSTTQVANLNVAQAGVADTISVAAGTGNNFIIFANAATGTVSELTSTGLIANLSNNSITATTFVGALSGTATSATTAGTVTTAAQPNITSVGTLTGLTVSGAVSITNSTAATSRTTGALIVTGGIGSNANSFFTNLNVASNIAYVAPNGANTINSQMLNGGTLAWSGNAGQLFSITDSMTGNIFTVNDVSGIPMISVDAGGNIQFAASGGFVSYGVTTAITAAGSTQGTATTLTRPINVVSTVASGANGIILPTVPSGARILIVNTSANALNVYPPSGAVVNSGSTNAAYSQPAGARLEYISTSTTQWYTLNATYG